MPSRKQKAAHANTDACGSRSPRAGEGRGGRGGEERPPSGRVVASQTAGPGAGGVTPAQRRVSPKEPGLCREGRREEEGDLFKLGGWASGKKKKKKK